MGEAKKRKNTINTLQAQKQISWMSYLPLYLIVAFIPHMYGYAPHAYAPSEAAIFGQKGYIDVYLIWKARGLFVLTVLAGIMFLWNVFNGKIKLKWDYFTISVSVMTGIILISTFTSKYQDVVYIGGRERFEGMYVYLCYMAIMFIARYYGNDEKFVKNISTFLMYSVFVMSIPIFFQAFGYDMYTMSPLVWIFYPPEIASKASELISMNMTGGTVGALFNSNYSGVFMLMGVVIALWKILEVESTRKKIFYLVIASLASFGLLTSKSDASMLAFSICIPMFLYFKKIEVLRTKNYFVTWILIFVSQVFFSIYLVEVEIQNYIYILMLVSSILAFFIGGLSFFQKKLNIAIITVLILILILFSPLIGVFFVEETGTHGGAFEKLELNDNSLYFKTKIMDDEAIFTFSNKRFETNLPEKTKVEFDNENHKIKVFRDDKHHWFINIIKGAFEDDSLLINIEYYELNLKLKNGKLYYLSTNNNTYSDEDVASIKKDSLFSLKPRLYTARAFIWSRFIPIIKDNLLLGLGADTFVQSYPQNDFMNKYNILISGNILVDKPHSIYFSWLLNYGVVFSLILIFTIFKSVFKVIYCNKNIKELSLIVVISVIVSGLFNDSLLGVSQILFLYIGIIYSSE